MHWVAVRSFRSQSAGGTGNVKTQAKVVLQLTKILIHSHKFQSFKKFLLTYVKQRMAKENATFVKAIVFIATGHFLLLQKTKEKHTQKRKKTGQIIRNISQALAYVLTFSDKLKRKANFVFQNCIQFTFRVPMGSNYHSLNHLSFVRGICLSFHFYDKISMRHINTHTLAR